jgi:DNA repair protein RecN (Recombination protein N)
LPQIAAYADTHLSISKGLRGDRTVTRVEQLDEDARLRELAQMLGGSAADDGARAAAAELLARAERTRSEASAVGA